MIREKVIDLGLSYGEIVYYDIYRLLGGIKIQEANIIFYFNQKDKKYYCLKNRYEGNHIVYNEIEWTLFRLTYNI